MNISFFFLFILDAATVYMIHDEHLLIVCDLYYIKINTRNGEMVSKPEFMSYTSVSARSAATEW